MCGIAGSFGYSNQNVMKSMLKSIHHRGPDDTGFFFDSMCMIGIKRLSILDLKLGKQPMTINNSSIALVFNGEIFNFIELKKKLIKKNCIFKTNTSDTEVILQGYRLYGINFIKKLNGMFAIAIYDKRKQTLFLARDRAGIKPLYYCKVGDSFHFASEIKAFFNLPFYKKEPCFESIDLFFSLKNIPSPKTAFKNTYQLEAGKILIVSKKGVIKKTFWDLNKKENYLKSNGNILEKIQDCLVNSVKKQLRSDVDVGCFLSGGLDSSAITVLASKHYQKRLKTFSIIYDSNIKSKNLDTSLSRKLAKKLGTEHYEFLINQNKLYQDLDNAILSFDQPFAGTLTSYFLSKEVSKHVKVSLTGDGADELFGSYIFPRVVEGKKNWNNKSNRKNFMKYSMDFKKKFINYSSLKNMSIYEIKDNFLSINYEQKKNFLKKENLFYQNINYIKKIYNKYSKEKDIINLALKIDFKSLLADQVLSFVDILSMQSSLEIRPPFLDNDMIDLAFKIEGEKKIKYSKQKVILKDAMRKFLPNEYIDRKKEGFVIPVEEMFLKKNKNKIKNILDRKNVGNHDLFNHDYVDYVIKNISKNDFYMNNRIWILYCFQIWWNQHFK